MTDLYPDEECVLLDGLSISFAKCVGTVALNQQVGLGSTAVSGVVSVIASAAIGDSVGVAMKAGAANDIIPVLFYGIAKFLAAGGIAAGAAVEGGVTAGVVVPGQTYTAGQLIAYKMLNYTGTRWLLGTALQTAASGDEILVLVGRGL